MINKMDEHEKFEKALIKLLSEMTPEAILQIPGVFESVSEHFTNEALTLIENGDI